VFHLDKLWPYLQVRDKVGYSCQDQTLLPISLFASDKDETFTKIDTRVAMLEVRVKPVGSADLEDTHHVRKWLFTKL
jgi:hypothetical protein